MRILYDISTLGLAHLYTQSRGGAYRADLHITGGLAASGQCELLFCANHSSVAYHGSAAFLAGHEALGSIPLLAAGTLSRHSPVRAATSATHRFVRQLLGTYVLPTSVRRCAAWIDTRLQRPVAGTASEMDVLHSPSVPLPPRAGRRLPARFVTVYDLSYTRFPELYGAAYQRGSAAMLESLHGDDRIVTASYFIRDELCERGIASADRIDVVPLAADPDTFYRCDDRETIAKVRVRYGIPDGPYVLSVNSPDPRKNVAHAIHAFAVAVHERRGPLSLVLAGNDWPASDRMREAITQYPGLRDCIVVPGHVPDHDLAPLYSAASAFVYPSIYEGFGLPPLEAMQCGTPAITLRTSALPEVVGDGGVMVPPGDRDALAAAMLAAVSDESGRSVRRHRALAQAGRFSWDRSTRTMLAAYRASLDGATAYTAIAASSHSASRLSR